MNEKGYINMKIWSVFSLVIVFHFAILGLLLIQPGCQSTTGDQPDPSMTAAGSSESLSQPVQQPDLDPAFNSGLPTASANRGNLSAPTRPSGVTRTSPQTGGLEPVLEPVRDNLSVPPVTSEYKVQKGDTLSGIAKKEGISLNDLLAANGLTKSSTIYVGQSLLVPSQSAPEDTASAELEHSGREVVVERGDTLSSIASRAGTSVNALKSLNGLTSDRIYVGQRLAVPEGSGVSGSTSSSGSSSQASRPSQVSGGTSYTVQAGDTPGGIASKFGLNASQLMAANNISDPRKLRVGQTLVIPGGGSAPAQTNSRPASNSQPVARSNSATTTPPPSQPEISEPSAEDPMSVLEALEDEDLPYVDVEVVEEGNNSGN